MSLAVMNPEEIQTHPTFSALFPIKAEMLARIEADMKEEGYDESQPVILAKWKGQEEPVCIDGHTRLRAAVNVGIESIPVFVRQVDDELAALTRSILGQVNRRRSSLTDSELFGIVRLLHGTKTHGECRRSEHEEMIAPSDDSELSRSRWAKNTAQLLRTSPSKVEKALTIQKHGTVSMAQAVQDGEVSIQKAFQKIQRLRRMPPPLFPDLPQWKMATLESNLCSES